ncbi:MAG: L-lactate dehydrogenase complex protein LldG [Actinomycetota bacterium]|nr:L-lactate dehydrogenase complex protein LldG [Actinomycetota bacterium]
MVVPHARNGRGYAVTSARDDVLSRIRAGNATGLPGGVAGDAGVPRDYRRFAEHSAGSAELVELLADRLIDYRATVHVSTTSRVAEAVRSALAEAMPAGGRVVVPPRLPDEWLVDVPDVVSDVGLLSAAELDGFGAVVTASAAACAETGTIVLDGGPDQGRRAISLVPDVHVCVVRAEQIVQTVPELLARVNPAGALTLISGPSATSDIELERVEGVHGPRNLHVILVTDGAS